MSQSNPYPVEPFQGPVAGKVRVPGSKSITNRALMLAALCPDNQDRPVELTGALFSRDTLIMMEGLRQLGVRIESDPASSRLVVCGREPHQSIKAVRESPTVEIEVGNAGTAARFLTAFAALQIGRKVRFDGDEAMRRRPMLGLVQALQQARNQFEFEAEAGYLPYTLEARGWPGGRFHVDARESSQILSALLMIAPRSALITERGSLLIAPGVRPSYVEITRHNMAAFGVSTEVDAASSMYRVPGKVTYASPGHFAIEPDLSAASYFLALPLVVGGRVLIEGLPESPLQGDIAFTGVLSQLGLQCRHDKSLGGWVSERVEPISPPAAPRRVFDFQHFSDTFLTLAALTPLLEHPFEIRGIGHTRHQETDRIAAMSSELKRLGQGVEEQADRLVLTPNRESALAMAKGGHVVRTYDDHRFAMSFAILGCANPFRNAAPWIQLENPSCVGKTFPDFFDRLADLRSQS